MDYSEKSVCIIVINDSGVIDGAPKGVCAHWGDLRGGEIIKGERVCAIGVSRQASVAGCPLDGEVGCIEVSMVHLSCMILWCLLRGLYVVFNGVGEF